LVSSLTSITAPTLAAGRLRRRRAEGGNGQGRDQPPGI
jgi:hypothetical protein